MDQVTAPGAASAIDAATIPAAMPTNAGFLSLTIRHDIDWNKARNVALILMAVAVGAKLFLMMIGYLLNK